MRSPPIIYVVIAAVVLLILASSAFIVDQRKSVLVLQTGRAVAVYNEPGKDEAGLRFKFPLIESVQTYDKRNIGLEIPNIEVITVSLEQLYVDAFVRYQITDPLRFYQAYSTQSQGEDRLQTTANTQIRNLLGTKKPEDIVSGQRAALMNEVRDLLSKEVAVNGVRIIDVRIRRADLPEKVSESVFRRMEASRNQEAELKRQTGAQEARAITAKADQEATVIIAEANKQAEQIRGEGDAIANEIYAKAYGKDAEFFRFQRALIACEKALAEGTRIVVAPNNLSLCDEFIQSARQASGR
jgi:membrane protease subunit HflC